MNNKQYIMGVMVVLLTITTIQAQVSSYKLTVKQSTYHALNNPTVLYNDYFAYKISDAINIPSFKYNGKIYDSIYLCTNGYLSFGPFQPDAWTYYPLSNYMNDEGIISGFGNALKGTSGGTSQVAYKQQGNELVFEWKDVRRYDYNEKINFQIRLNYKDFSISFVYGNMIPKSYAYNRQQIGLRGNNYNDYINLEVDTTNNWNTPRIGKSNKSKCYFHSDKPTIKPSSGLTYVFSPSNMKPKCTAETNNPFNIEHFSPTNNISVIVEEGNYLWVGSQGGLMKRHKATGQIVAKYDVSNGLPRNRVVAIAIDNKGNKWVSCERALAMFDGKDWKVFNAENTNGKLNNDISSLTIDWDGNLWVASYWSGRMVKYDGKDWTVFNAANNGICSGRIHDVEIDPYNNMWIAGDQGYTVYDGTDWKCYDTSNSGIADNYVADIFIQNDTVWFATSGGLSFFTGTSWGNYSAANSGLISNDLNSVLATPDGNLWIGSWGYGLYKFDRTNWTRFHAGNSDLKNNVIGPMLVDGQGDLWLGTYNGLYKYHNSNFYSFIQNKEIAGSWVVDIIPDKTGVLWFITHEGISKYVNGQWETFKVGLWFGSAEFENDSLLLIIKGDGVMNFNINSHNTWYSKLGNKDLLDMKKDTNGNIWFTFDGEGVKMYNPSTQSFTTYNASNSGLPDDIVTGVDVDQSGNIWFSTHAGVAKFDGTTWTVYNKSNFGGNTNEINDIGVAYNGDIWISPSWNGVAKFDGTNWMKYTKFLGLIDYSIDRIYCEKDTNLVWFCSYNGVSRYDGSTFVNYSDENGLPEKGINDVFVYNNDIWLATQAGVSKLHYKKPEVDYYANTACYPAKTYLSSISCFTDPSTKYEWDVNNDGTADYFSKNIEHAFSTQGNYNVKLSVTNGNQKQTFSKSVTVGLKPTINLTPGNNLKICSGQSQLLTTTITNYNSQFNYDYYWNTGDSVSSINVKEEGKYKVRVGIDECYSDWDSLDLGVMTPFDSAEICMVSVDPNTGKNMIIWERHKNRGIASYNIYKLLGNTYVPIGNMSINQLSVFIDQSSDPDTRAARYAISVVDTCGNESKISPYHQTIQLGAAKGTQTNSAVLDWTEYIDESGGFKPDWYYIYKGNHPYTLQLFDSVSGSFSEWNDTNAVGAIYYQVSVVKPELCSPAIYRAQNYSGPFSQSVSNLKDYGVGQNDYLEVSPQFQYISKKAGSSTTFNIFTNKDSIEVSCNESWVNISLNEFAKFFIVTSNSETTTERTATITVKVSGLTAVDVTLVQGENVSLQEGHQLGSIKMFPNPTTSKVFVLVEDANEFTLELFDMSGKKLLHKNLKPESTNELDLSAFAKGIYFVRFKGQQETGVEKIILK